MGRLEERKLRRENWRREMELAVDGGLGDAIAAAERDDIEAEELAIHAAYNTAAKFTSVGTAYFNAQLIGLLGERIRKSEYFGFAGDIHIWRDRIVLYDQGFEVHRMDAHVRASVETAGELMVSKRPTLTRMAVGSVLPGTALIPGLAFQKQTIRDTRALFLALEHPKWGRLIQVAPQHEAAMRQVAINVNQAATRLGHADEGMSRSTGDVNALDALKQLWTLNRKRLWVRS